MIRLLLALLIAVPLAAQQTQAAGNALADAPSRYLRDASTSQVMWRPFGQAAFELAKRGNRPIFLSIGYASSFESYRLHREAFGNAAIAESLNGYYIPVLVDRFTQPEVAEAFDTIQRSMTSGVTTPSSFVLTPALEPFAVIGPATPKELSVFVAVNASRWANERDVAIAEGRSNLEKARNLGERRAPGDINATLLTPVIAAEPMALSFALRVPATRERALDTLRELAKSPRHDRVGGGFHRGETAFEKILPDQALFAIAYLEAFQLTGEAEFEAVLRSTLDYAVRDLHLETSGFYAAQDAYSLIPGQGPEVHDAAFYKTGLPFEERQKRPQPFRDFTEIAGWNGLMISALARAGAVLDEPRYRDVAVIAARRITGAKTFPLAEDYAMVVQGVLDLFDATYDVKWLELAKTLQQKQDQAFWNAGTGRYSTGTSLPESLRGLLVENDELTPSVNAASAMNLLRLALLTGNETWRARPMMIFQSFGGRLRNDLAQLPQLGSALASSFASPKLVFVTGDARRKETHELLHAMHKPFEPLRAVIFAPHRDADRKRVATALPFTAALAPDPERAVAYVCEGGECRRK